MATSRFRALRRGRAAVLVLAMAVFFGSLAGPAQAAPIGVTYNMDVSLIAGLDTLGLDGASMSLTILFDTADVYTGTDPFPFINATSDSLTISGASVSTSNGTFSSNAGIRFFPTFAGQFFGGAGSFANYTVGSVPLVLGPLATQVAGVSVGNLIDASHFGTTTFFPANPGCNWCASTEVTLNDPISDSRYSVSNFSATAVPEPATLTLLGLGLLGFARARRRRT